MTSGSALRCMSDSVEARVDGEFQIPFRTDFHDLAVAAPSAARASRIRAEFLAPNDDRGNIFRCFHRHRTDPGWKRGRVQTILGRSCAGSSRVESDDFKISDHRLIVGALTRNG